MNQLEIKRFKKMYASMDVKSEEFSDIAQFVEEKYWDIKDPDDYQKAAKLLALMATRGEEKDVILAVKIIQEIVMMDIEKRTSTMAELGYADKSYFFTLTTKRGEIEAIQQMMRKMVIKKAKETKDD